jgi:ectoine hydroxylase-related dioxygenase (phytanoyl-CoA dioxygenase family)
MKQDEYKYQEGTKGRGLVLSRRLAYGLRALAFSPTLLTQRKALLGLEQARNDRPTQVMNDIANSTNGSGLDAASKAIRVLIKNQTKDFDRALPNLEAAARVSKAQRSKIVAQLRDTGFAVIPGFLDSARAKALHDGMLKVPGRDRSPAYFSSEAEWLKTASTPRIDADRDGTKFVVDKFEIDFASLLLIAREFLGCRPIQLGPNSWTTKKVGHVSPLEADNNAMAFHSDSDFFGFVKAFLLLTEVDEQSGPFTFVAGSHKEHRQVQGRLSDEKLNYREGDLRFGTGKPGDLVLAVTTGWHKASIPQKGYRMMIQWMFTNSLFGSATQ